MSSFVVPTGISDVIAPKLGSFLKPILPSLHQIEDGFETIVDAEWDAFQGVATRALEGRLLSSVASRDYWQLAGRTAERVTQGLLEIGEGMAGLALNAATMVYGTVSDALSPRNDLTPSRLDVYVPTTSYGGFYHVSCSVTFQESQPLPYGLHAFLWMFFFFQNWLQFQMFLMQMSRRILTFL